MSEGLEKEIVFGAASGLDAERIEAICGHLHSAIQIANGITQPALRYFLAMAALEASSHRTPGASHLLELLYPNDCLAQFKR